MTSTTTLNSRARRWAVDSRNMKMDNREKLKPRSTKKVKKVATAPNQEPNHSSDYDSSDSENWKVPQNSINASYKHRKKV